MTVMEPPYASCSRKRKRPPGELGDELSSTRDEDFQPTQEAKYVVDEDEDEEEEELVQLRTKREYQQVLKAQEPSTVEQYDDIKVTPFNLDDEREEGDFDEAGNFTFKRESKKDELYDTWAESVDWKAVEEKQRRNEDTASRHDFSEKPGSSPTPTQPTDRLACFKQMLRIMRPDETVQRAIKRLGDSLPKRRFNNKAKHKSEQPGIDETAVKDLKSKLDKMIELAHGRLEDGEIDIYQKSYEDLEEAINS